MTTKCSPESWIVAGPERGPYWDNRKLSDAADRVLSGMELVLISWFDGYSVVT